MVRYVLIGFAAPVLLACSGMETASSAPADSESQATEITAAIDQRIAAINQDFVFADIHAHPSRFHRANVPSISDEEIDLYLSRRMDLVVANISSDMAYTGSYTNADGTKVEKGQYKPAPGETFALAMDRLQRAMRSFESGKAVHADNPAAVLAARKAGKLAIMPALEGADALEGSIENLRTMHAAGLRLIQLVHFRANELGHIQTFPYSPGGLTEFGRDVIREANRLGMVIDLAHCNTETIMDVLALSEDPVVFSHGGLKALLEQDRALSDAEVRAIAEKGGVIGIWPHGRHVPTVARMVDHFDHIIELVGPEHAGIGSDLRGVSRYSEGFSNEAEFRSIAMELLKRGHSDATVGQIMGGNFFALWLKINP